MRHLFTLAAVAVLASCTLTSSAPAGVFFYDDFESPITPVTYWVNTVDDADPTTPVIGPTWGTLENVALYQIQETNHPTDLVGPPWDGGAGPTFDSSTTGGNQYLHMWGYPTLNGYAEAPIPASEQANITASGHLRLDVETYALSGVDGWHGGLRITGWDGVVAASPRGVFDIILMEDGTVLNNVGTSVAATTGNSAPYNPGFNTVLGLTHNINTWETLRIVANFNTDTFALTLDGVTVGGLTWNGVGLSKIQSVTLALPHISAPRGGYDNFSLYEPEPSSLAAVGLGAVVMMWRRRTAA